MYNVVQTANGFETKVYDFDFCVVGGGLAGMCAAIAAARHGCRTALMHDRPMPGGNASSEIRVWISGADGENAHETGIVEELMQENFRLNPYKNYSLWDGVMYAFLKREKNLTVFYNCSCLGGEMSGERLVSVTGWQSTAQKYIKINAKIFADCSGDAVLAPITGAPFMLGREAQDEYAESIEPQCADSHTMGMSCLITVRECDSERSFTPPAFARHLTADDLPCRLPRLSSTHENFWYLELGGMDDSIGDTEDIRDRLVALAYGMCDFMKNDPSQREINANYEIEWIGMLPGKRESRRYVGAHVLTQNDIESGGHFDDVIAFGGWPLDDHDPRGFDTKDSPNFFKSTPRQYGIPYRCLYSQHIKNLMFAGRNISATHAAISSTRVIATCALLGQAAGTAAALAVSCGILPCDILGQKMTQLQNELMYDGCFLPYKSRSLSPLTRDARIVSDMLCAEKLRSGVDRPVADDENGAVGSAGCFFAFEYDEPRSASELRIVFDCDLNRETLPDLERKLRRNMFMNRLKAYEPSHTPCTLVRDFDIEIKKADGGVVRTPVRGNCRYIFTLPLGLDVLSVRVNILATHGCERVRVFAFDVV